MTAFAPDRKCRLGVLAFGDSITNGGGELQWGVALQSWALWVARGLGLPFTGYATDGARAADVVRAQIPTFKRRSAKPQARYELGCLYIGVNDVRAPDWCGTRFESLFREALGFLNHHCELLLTALAPLDLGRPRCGAKVRELNAAIARAAADSGALVLDLSEFGARNLVMPDHVHPTAFGQIAIAERALTLLERNEAQRREHPSAMVFPQTATWWGRLRGDATYAYRHAKVTGRALRMTALAKADTLRQP